MKVLRTPRRFAAAAAGAPLVALLVLAGCGHEEGSREKLARPAGDPDRPASAPASGKWRAARAAPSPQGGPADLLALPYLKGYRPAREGAVVVRHDRERAWQGLNLYVSGHAAEAYLVDMEGKPLHRWRRDLADVWPELYTGPGSERIREVEYWRRAELLPDGDLLAIFEGLGLVRLDRDSRVRWAYRGGAHHDLFTRPDGSIWFLDRRRREIATATGPRQVLDDLVTVVDADGRVLRQISILDAIARSEHHALLERLPAIADVLHTNTLEWIVASELASSVPGFREGNLLLSILQLDTVAVLDPQEERIVWAMTGPWRRQHQPTLLPGGRMLVFDNLGAGGSTRVLEIEPANREVHWSWPATPSADTLYSKTLGSVQRLPNGNTLITESENGRALEIDPDGEVVWELSSPHRAGEHAELVATLFEVVRLPAAAGDFLARAGYAAEPAAGSGPGLGEAPAGRPPEGG